MGFANLKYIVNIKAPNKRTKTINGNPFISINRIGAKYATKIPKNSFILFNINSPL